MNSHHKESRQTTGAGKGRSFVKASLLFATVLAVALLSTIAIRRVHAASPDPLSAQALAQRAEDLDRKEQALKSMEADLNARLVKLKGIEATLKSMLDDAKSIKDERMVHLISVYTNMKAKQAATVMETLDEKVAVKVLSGMKGRQAGEILNAMTPKKAAKLSEELTKLQVGPELPQLPK